MTAYTAMMLGVLGIMGLLLYVAFKLGDKYDPLKIFFVGMFFIWGVIVLNIGNQIAAANAAPTNLVNALSYGLYVWIVISGIALLYILFYIIPDAYNAMKKGSKKGMYDD